MTNKEKNTLRQLCKKGFMFSEIRDVVSCSNATIKNYLKIFGTKAKNK